ncbi:phage major capsid protein [Catenuloplanes indicus]|uniref:Major capsid protein n=1 Tax=Catenuloplanes indicus TaxID=137267 RepID=A0AAE3WAN4_9ACTN|nr:hypothetical protein [Catenuloplanes indicus]MDQ0371602.1 hypothetical protein [Catenuloplanes indicus]MDQ0371615.1 hypothetical protein [Catenuloplanes indicus]
MPGAYPPAAATLSGTLLTIDRLLRNPTFLARRLRGIPDLRFVADQILTRKIKANGGAAMAETGEPIVNSRPIESIAPGGEYPRDSPADGTAMLVKVSKWGEATPLTDEKIKRSVYGGDEVDRSLRKAANTIITKVDRLATSAMGSLVTATSAAAATWDNASALLFRDVEKAAAKVVDLNQGFRPNTLLMSTTKYAMLVTDPAIAALRRREATDNPIYGGDIEYIGKYRIISTSVGNLPRDSVWVFDDNELGGMADETEVDPGYATMDNGLQFKVIRVDSRDAWDIQARRITAPMVTEPGAAIEITGTGSLG